MRIELKGLPSINSASLQKERGGLEDPFLGLPKLIQYGFIARLQFAMSLLLLFKLLMKRGNLLILGTQLLVFL